MVGYGLKSRNGFIHFIKRYLKGFVDVFLVADGRCISRRTNGQEKNIVASI